MNQLSSSCHASNVEIALNIIHGPTMAEKQNVSIRTGAATQHIERKKVGTGGGRPKDNLPNKG